jgi:hypothetical protein
MINKLFWVNFPVENGSSGKKWLPRLAQSVLFLLNHAGGHAGQLALLDRTTVEVKIGGNVCPVFVVAIFGASSAVIRAIAQDCGLRARFFERFEDV